MNDKLSPEMIKAVRIMQLHKGIMIRYKGGFWAEKGATMTKWASNDVDDHPAVYVGKNTMEALANRGLAEPTDWHNGIPGRPQFAIQYELTKEGLAYELPTN